MSLFSLPELRSLERGGDAFRIPDEQNIPVTNRVRRLVDTSAFRRLSRISQLGLVSLVYPGATHTRFEHSLGVYRNALLFVRQLAGEPRFEDSVDPNKATALLAAALVHDIGHWPFCHPIEDICLPGIPEHEELAENFLRDEEVANCLADDWNLDPAAVSELLHGKPKDNGTKLLQSILSGPIDIDKLDYLFRDSLHAGVPYGKHFDRARLIASLCVNEEGDGLAISLKGKTAAELMVFARYVMFSEVYWHHAVRSATAMLQRSFYRLRDRFQDETVFRQDEPTFRETLFRTSRQTTVQALVDGIFGERRHLYKRLAEYSFFEDEELYSQLARRPYEWLAGCSDHLADLMAKATGLPIQSDDVLIDAPPVGLEVEFNVEVRDSTADTYRPLGEVSPVIKTLAQRQFDDFVKRVRILVHPKWRDAANSLSNVDDLVQMAVQLNS